MALQTFANRAIPGDRRLMKHTALLISYVIPLALLVWFCACLSVNVPIHDQWRLVPLFEKVADGNVCFADVWALHSNHRIVFPKIIFSALAFGTHWNIYCEITASILFAIATFLLILRLSANDGRTPQDSSFHLTNILCGCLVFSLAQHENWLWGFQIAWFLVNACVVTAIVALRPDGNAFASRLMGAASGRDARTPAVERSEGIWNDVRLVLAAMCCVIASFSSAQGLLSWPALVPSVIALGGKTTRIRQRLAVWAFLFALTVALYSIDYHPKRDASLALLWESPVVCATYFLNLLGSPLVRSPVFSSVLGLGVLSLFVFLLLHFTRRGAATGAPAPWLSLGFFAVLSAAFITLGRAHFGALHALDSPRYTTISTVLIVADLQLALMFVGGDRSGEKWAWRRHLPRLAAVVLIGAIGAQSYLAIAQAKAALVYRQGAQDGLNLIHYLEGSFFDDSPDSCLWGMTSKTRLVRSGAEVLNRIGFRHVVTDVTFVDDPPADYGVFEVPPHAWESVRVKKSDRLRLAGWVTSPRQQELPHLVLLSYGNKQTFFANAFVNGVSPNWVTPFDPQWHSRRRWSVTCAAKYLPIGESRIKAWVYDPKERQFLKLEGDAVVTVEEG